MSKKFIPPAIEEMINALNDPGKSRALRETHLAMIERSIEALETAVSKYKTRKASK